MNAFCNVPQHSIAILRTIHGLYAHGSIRLSGISHVHSDRLSVRLLCLANNNLDDFTVLAKVVGAAQSLQQTVFLNARAETRHIDKVLLHNA